MRYIIALVLLLMFANCFSQQDSLKGYGDFVFGQTWGEVKKILDKNSKYYIESKQKIRTISRDFFIRYNDVIKSKTSKDWRYVYFPMEVRLYFDSLNNLKFYEAEIEIENECKTLQEAFEQTNLILDILIEKYGSNFDMQDFMKYGDWGVQEIDDIKVFVHPKSQIYTWKFLNATIKLDNDFSNFYKDNLENFQISGFGDKEYENRKYIIRVTYSDTELAKENFQRSMKRIKEKNDKEEEEKLKKF